VLDDRTVAYLDVSGSGAETIAHLRENGRIVIMLCAFSGPPRILRLHGTGHAVRVGEEGFEQLQARASFEDPSIEAARRAIVVVDVTRIADSCGYGVPLMAFEGTRSHHAASVAKRLAAIGREELDAFNLERGAVSIDGLPALAGGPAGPSADK
jgi:hypothetical protein